MRADIRVIVFDMDGVLVDIESSWSFVHQALHVDGSGNMREFLQGSIDYEEFMRRDIRLWGDIHVDKIKAILDQAPLMKGAIRVSRELKQAGYSSAIISAGISILAERLGGILGIDSILANELLTDEKGFLTGEGKEVVGLLRKEAALGTLALRQGLNSANYAIIGDSIYDVPLFEEAGLSIAFNTTNEKVRQAADVAIAANDLELVLPHLMELRN